MKNLDELILFLHKYNVSEFLVFEKIENNYNLFFSFPVVKDIKFNNLQLENYQFENIDLEIVNLFIVYKYKKKDSLVIDFAIEVIKNIYYRSLNQFHRICKNLNYLTYKILYFEFDEFISKMFNSLNSFNDVEFAIFYINSDIHKIERLLVFDCNNNMSEILPNPLEIDNIKNFNKSNFIKKLQKSFLSEYNFYIISLDKLAGINGKVFLFFKEISFYKSINNISFLKTQLNDIVNNLIYFYFFLKEQDYYIQELEKILSSKKEEIKYKNIKLLKQLNYLTKNEKAKSSLFSNVYHHLLTPLNSIVGFTMYLINFNKHKLEPEILESIYSIEGNTYYLYFFVLNIITYTKHFSNNFRLNLENFMFILVNSQFKRVLTFFKNNFGLKIKLNLPQNDFYFYSDKNAIQQIIFSIILFFSYTKSPPIQLNISIEKNKKRKILVIKFSLENTKMYKNYITTLDKFFKQSIFYKTDSFEISDFSLFIASFLLRELKGNYTFNKNLERINISIKIPESEKK